MKFDTFSKFYCTCLLIFILGYKGYSQILSSKTIEDSVTSIKASGLPLAVKLNKFYYFKAAFEKRQLPLDSTYGKILHLIGTYEYLVNKDYPKAINATLSSVQINSLPQKKSSPFFALRSYYNIAFYYCSANLYIKALQYCDSTILHAEFLRHSVQSSDFILDAKILKAFIFFRRGDYQKSIDESTLGINSIVNSSDSLYYLRFLNQRSQAFLHQNQFKQSLNDVNKAIELAEKLKDPYQLASAYKMKGAIYIAESNFSIVLISYQKAIKYRLVTEDYGQVAGDYNDLGNFYADSLRDFKQAKDSYFKGIEFAQKDKDSLRLARINANLGNVFFQQKQFAQAQLFYTQAFNYLKLNTAGFFVNPPSQKNNLVGDKELLIFLLSSKTELLLNQYCQNHQGIYLDACIKTALVTDSVINETRHEQLGEQSKLYWRNHTRAFYTNALEACYLANNAERAFFFMEKSRAVLLNDRLNELGAAAQLPAREAEKEDSLRSNIIQQQQQLNQLKEGTKDYNAQQLKLINANENWGNYIHSIEQKFPGYYQYKYNDQVPDLQSLQKFLSDNNQAFVHYFIADSLIYILGITPNATRLIKVGKAGLNPAQLTALLKICADRQQLNAHFPLFTALSNSIYTVLFQPLKIQQKRVVVCADNFLIPFGALCTDKTGKHFLLQDYAFSYAYSARSLLKPFNNPPSQGDLFGIAPVTFAPYLQLPALKQSGNSLNNAADFFSRAKLLLNQDATKYSFIKMLPKYSIANVFSHASVDTSGEDPLLFMADSVLHLSELQKLKSPSTQLVVLSACQTNVGKLATGEGIYSLARGFASSGIPSVAATLWKADEDAIYEITQLFDKNLAQGMRKDDALQQAEIIYMQHGNEKRMPYYWANMVLVGNAEPVKLSSPMHWWFIFTVAGLVLVIAAIVIIKKRKNNFKKHLLLPKQ